MDSCLNCAKQRREKRKQQHREEEESKNLPSTEGDDEEIEGVDVAYCGTLTDITPPIGEDAPGAVIMLPIFPGNAPKGDVVGFIGSSLLWSDILEKAFNSRVSGIDVVIRTSASPDVAYTWRVVGGEARYSGKEGDFHDPAYDSYQRTTILTDVLKYGVTGGTGSGWVIHKNNSKLDEEYGVHGDLDGDEDVGLSDDSPEYYLTIYPSDDFFTVFSTQNPRLAMMGAVLIIVFTSLFFFGYDALVAKEMRKNHEIIEGRRRFMRFVSHEVVSVSQRIIVE
jgi:hypothetical protein